MASTRGVSMFFLSLLRENHPDVTESVALELLREKGEECKRALLRVAPPFFLLLLDEYPDVVGTKESDRPAVKAQLMEKLLPLLLKSLLPTTPTGAESSTP
jgi:hypothetical protein